MEEKKKSNIGLIITIIILILVILGLVGFIAYDKGLIFSNNNKKQETVEIDNELDDIDYEEISEELEKYFYINNELDVYNSLSTDASKRIRFVQSFITKFDEYEKREDLSQNNPYVKKEYFISKYKEVYGNNYSFEEDLKKDKGRSTLEEYNNDYYSWNGTIGVTGVKEQKIIAEELTKEDDDYVLTGYVETTNVDEKQNKYSFKLIYTKKGENKYLKDIIVS